MACYGEHLRKQLHYATRANGQLMVVAMSSFSTKNQKGVVLMITLAILLVVTILGVSTVQSTNVQVRMARNARDGRVAFQASEASLRIAEDFLSTESSLNAYQANTSGKYEERGVGETPRWEEDATWDDEANSIEVTYTDSIESPRYIIEFIETVVSEEDRLNMDNVGGGTGSGRTQMFRVTAYGTGKTASAKSKIQSTYGRRF